MAEDDAPTVRGQSDAYAWPIYAPIAPVDFTTALLRGCLEDLSGLRQQRRPQSNETWRAPGDAEARLLCQLDALVGTAPQTLEAILSTADADLASDPDRLFAHLLVLGCIATDSALATAAQLVSNLDEPEEPILAAAVEALAVAPHPGMCGALKPFLAHRQPHLRSLALDVLAFRREARPQDVTRLLHDPDPRVLAAALNCLNGFERRAVPGSVSDLLSHPEELVVRSALRVCIRHRLVEGYAAAARLCKHPGAGYADAALSLAVAGRREDLGVLRKALVHGEHPAAALAAGRYGHVELVPDLISALRAPDEALRAMAATALGQITGAGLTTEIVVPAHEDADADFYDEPPAPQKQTVPSPDPDAWQIWWKTNKSRFDSTKRYRSGRTLTVKQLVIDLADTPASTEERLLTYSELCVLAGDASPRFHPLDFVAVQEQSIEAWQSWAALASVTAVGAWAS